MATWVSGKSRYVCRDCGAVAIRWQGQCPGCSAWNTLEEQRAEPAARTIRSRWPHRSVLERLSDISVVELPRRPTGIGRVRSRARRRSGTGLGGADRRRPGHRQVDAAAAGAGRGRRRRRTGRVSRLRDRRGKSLGQVALRAQRLGLEAEVAAGAGGDLARADRRHHPAPSAPRSSSSIRSRRW